MVPVLLFLPIAWWPFLYSSVTGFALLPVVFIYGSHFIHCIYTCPQLRLKLFLPFFCTFSSVIPQETCIFLPFFTIFFLSLLLFHHHHNHLLIPRFNLLFSRPVPSVPPRVPERPLVPGGKPNLSNGGQNGNSLLWSVKSDQIRNTFLPCSTETKCKWNQCRSLNKEQTNK